MNKNFGGVLEALRGEHEGGTTGMDGMDVPTTAATVATVTTYSYDSGSDPDSGGREERRHTKKERNMRDRQEKRKEER